MKEYKRLPPITSPEGRKLLGACLIAASHKDLGYDPNQSIASRTADYAVDLYEALEVALVTRTPSPFKEPRCVQ